MLTAKIKLILGEAEDRKSGKSLLRLGFETEKGKTVAIGGAFGESPRRQQERWLSG